MSTFKDDLLEIVPGVSREDFLRLCWVLDSIPQKDESAWPRLAAATQGRYEPERLREIFQALCAYFAEPADTTKLFTRAMYELKITRDQVEKFPLLNLGYHATSDGPPLDPSITLDGLDAERKCNLDMYRLWLHGGLINGRDVVEVGSGRGGGASFLCRRYQPRSYTGVDGCRQSVRLCREVYGESETGPRFVHGHAAALPFPAASADLVINIESSHCYSELEKFFREVHRILRDDGVFIWTDVVFLKSQLLPHLSLLERYFDVEAKADITKNVTSCLEAHGVDQFRGIVESAGGLGSYTNVELLTLIRIYLPLDISPHSLYRSLAVSEGLYVSMKCRKRRQP